MKARIKTRFATAKETARVLGVSKSRFKLLERLSHSGRIFKRTSEGNSIGKDAGSPMGVHVEFIKRASDSTKPEGKAGTGKRKVGKKLAPRSKGIRVPKRPAEVFLNIPYDTKFDRLFRAYICGISAFGLVPRATLEIPGGARRLDRILELIRSCAYAVHDLSRVELDALKPRTPRFNMPFELGLSVAHEKSAKKGKHEWFVCESMNFRLAKSLSDLNGTD
jgi:hypothetical protein